MAMRPCRHGNLLKGKEAIRSLPTDSCVPRSRDRERSIGGQKYWLPEISLESHRDCQGDAEGCSRVFQWLSGNCKSAALIEVLNSAPSRRCRKARRHISLMSQLHQGTWIFMTKRPLHPSSSVPTSRRSMAAPCEPDTGDPGPQEGCVVR